MSTNSVQNARGPRAPVRGRNTDNKRSGRSLMAHARRIALRQQYSLEIAPLIAAFVAMMSLMPHCAIARSADLERRVAFHIPAQPLDTALLEWSKQAGIPISVAAGSLHQVQAPPLKGTLPARAALAQLLGGSGLRYEAVGATITILPAAARESSARAASPSGLPVAADSTSESGEPAGGTDDGLPKAAGKNSSTSSPQEVVVTGTHIRGDSNLISPTLSFDRDQIEQKGYSTTDDFIRSLPQNFAGGSAGASPDGILGGGATAAGNNEAASGVDLRGLGPNSTLTLLNGHRMAPSDFGSVVDISIIPLSALDHVDIVTDGSSAIYGADAVAGVVNFVLRKDYEGAETTARYGTVTDGNMHEELLSQTIGNQWDSGGVVASLQYRHQGALPTNERPFTEDVLSPTDILPATDRYSGLFSAHQAIASNFGLFVDGLAADNLVARDETVTTAHSISSKTRNTSVNVTGGVDYQPFGDWNVEVSGTFSRQGLNLTNWRYTNPPVGYTPGAEALVNTDRMDSGDIGIDGSLIHLPGGSVKAAIGGTWRTEEFDAAIPYEPLSTPGQNRSFGRHVGAEYAELSVPLVGEENAAPLIRKVQVSLAVRHDDYSDFGGTTNTKYGLLWSPVEALALRASYGTSFRPPDAIELINRALGLSAFNYNLAAPSGSGTVRVLGVSGVSPNLGPETSKSWNAGFDYRPSGVPDMHVAIDYYSIDFTNRIITPTFDVNALQKPGVYGSLISPISSQEAAAYVASLLAQGGQFFDYFGYGTSGIQYLYDIQTLNAAVVKQAGWDLDADYTVGSRVNQVQFRLNTAYIAKIDTQYTVLSVPTDVVNTYGNPLRLRIRADATWTYESITANLAGNFSNAYTDTTSTPYGTVGSLLTFDVALRYSPAATRGFSVGLSAMNLLNRYPPYVTLGATIPGVHYDVGNAEPEGRFVALDVRQKW